MLGNPDNKISFLHTSVSNKLSENKNHFDYAMITYVIHEVNEKHRINLLRELSQIADKIIVGDYLVPKLRGFWSALNEIIEFVAGNDNYRNYKNYVERGGIKYLAIEAGLKIRGEIMNKP